MAKVGYMGPKKKEVTISSRYRASVVSFEEEQYIIIFILFFVDKNAWYDILSAIPQNMSEVLKIIVP